MMNYFVTSLLPPEVLPKMSFEKEGIPDDCRTLVVVPMLLTTPSAIQSQLSRLEIHYLGNTDANLRFSLLSDFSDAPRRGMPEDAEYIDIVARGVEELNRRHGAGRFFLFHRAACGVRASNAGSAGSASAASLSNSINFLSANPRPSWKDFSMRAIVHSSRAFVSSLLWMPIPNCCATPPGG